MTSIRGRIDFEVPLPIAVDLPGLERLAKAITTAHEAIGAFTAAVAGLGGRTAYRPKPDRRRTRAAPVAEDHVGLALPGQSPAPAADDLMKIPPELRR